jgi:hypothetical protein
LKDIAAVDAVVPPLPPCAASLDAVLEAAQAAGDARSS